RELSGNAPQAPTQFQAPGIVEFKDAKSAVEKGTEDRLGKIYKQQRALGIHPDQALAAAKQYLGTEKPKVITDDRDDTYASPRAAAERLQQLRNIEATEAQKARAAAAMFETKDLNLGKTPAQIEEEFSAPVPDLVRKEPDQTEARELWKAQLKATGDLVSVQTIEAYEESYAEATRREQAEQTAATEQAIQSQPAQPEPQPQPQAPLPPSYQTHVEANLMRM